MKVLVIHDLHPFATRDIGDGVAAGLRDLGHDVEELKMFEHVDQPPDAVAAEVYRVLSAGAPQLTYCVSGWGSSRQRGVLDHLRRAGSLLVLHLTESPYLDDEQAALVGNYDVVLVNDPASLPAFRRIHPDARYMPQSFNPAVHRPPSHPVAKHLDSVLIGTGFRERVEPVKALRAAKVGVFLGGEWPDFGQAAFYSNADLPRFYHCSRVCLNHHRTTRVWRKGSVGEAIPPGSAWSAGPRVFEVLACGGFLLTDHRPELDALGLRDGEHCAIYRTTAELVEKARYYIAHDEERERIAAAGRKAIEGCRFRDRLASVLSRELA